MVKKRRARLSEQSEREMLRGDVVADSEGGRRSFHINGGETGGGSFG